MGIFGVFRLIYRYFWANSGGFLVILRFFSCFGVFLFLFCLLSCTALFIYTKMLQELVCLEVVVNAFGTVLCEVQFVHKRLRPLMKCTAFNIAENVSENLFLSV